MSPHQKHKTQVLHATGYSILLARPHALANNNELKTVAHRFSLRSDQRTNADAAFADSDISDGQTANACNRGLLQAVSFPLERGGMPSYKLATETILPMNEFKYRADIDGLRALAVSLVLLFHAGLGFPGGFVGVDVFFVISGFLITGILWKKEQEIHLSEFWIRRTRRILPASLVVVAATLVAGYVILLPSDFSSLAKSAIAQQAMVSNVFFWRNTGYFSGDAELKPLLHTWSLGVEEQFYLGYPLLVSVLRRFSRRTATASLAAMFVVSFAMSEWGIQTRPSAAFFLLPTRAWEMIMGGLLQIAPVTSRPNKTLSCLLEAVGLTAILAPALLYGPSTRFPALSALPPCLGAALIIHANSHDHNILGKLLSTKPAVYVGLLSYSLYLWHWPILSYLKHINCGATPSLLSRISALAASFVISAVTMRLIETPFRSRKLLPQTKHLILATALSSIFIVGCSSLIVLRDGYPGRFSQRALSYAAAKKSASFIRQVTTADISSGNIPEFGETSSPCKCVIWGDSHAMALTSGLDSVLKEYHTKGIQTTHASTAPILDFYVTERYGLNENAPAFNSAVIDMIIKQEVQGVILAGLWSSYTKNKQFEECLYTTTEKLIQAGIQVAIVRDVAMHKADIPTLLSMSDRFGWDQEAIGVTQADYAQANDRCDQVFSKLRNRGVMVLDPQPLLTDERGFWRSQFNGVSMYRDSHHLSTAGSLRISPIYIPFIEALCNSE